MGHQRQAPKHLACKLLAIRQRLNLSQSQIAKQIGLKTGSSRISEYELGKRIPDLITVLHYARLAGVKMDAIVDDDLELIIPERKRKTLAS